MGEPRTIHFVSLGCAKNRVDTEVMLGVSGESGFEIVDDPGAAEVIVVNTCGFIGPAKEESIQTILEMGGHKESGTCKKLVVAGCLSQRYPGELASELLGSRQVVPQKVIDALYHFQGVSRASLDDDLVMALVRDCARAMESRRGAVVPIAPRERTRDSS